MLLNEKLRMLRKEKNLTQEELAEQLNVSRQAITKWESGEGIPDVENLKQISTLFNVIIDDLVKEDKTITIVSNKKYTYVEKLEIDHTKHFDIYIPKTSELNIIKNIQETVKIELLSDEEEQLNECYKIKFDNLYNRLDINIKGKKEISDITINIYLPEKYIEEIELNAKLKYLNIINLEIEKLEYDGSLKYLNVKNSKGRIVLNTSKSDVEATYDKLNGILEMNTINSTTRVEIPKNTKYKTIVKGIKNQFIDATNTEEAKNIIEINGINSKVIMIEK